MLHREIIKLWMMNVPTLLLNGSESPQILKDSTKAVNQAPPNSRIHTFDGHGHAALNTATDLFIAEILAFGDDSDE